MISFQSLQSLGTNTEPIFLCQPTLIFLSLSNSSKVKPLLTLHEEHLRLSPSPGGHRKPEKDVKKMLMDPLVEKIQSG
uniref:Uncharacterized protein n=1 Tax=Physcomitrium patens TaxID=3218 RepID=A0A2K1IZN0_PHYPA|nr:hypothetical protein PHYPA_022629 [Physcomitrium patens]